MSIHLILLFLSLSPFHVSRAIIMTNKQVLSIHPNPFTPKASLVRYWNTRISNSLPKPTFFFSKSSPLTPQDSAFFANLAAQNSLSSHFHSFCSLANLYCSFDSSSPQKITPAKDSNFALYSNKRFASYGAATAAGTHSFKNYSDGLNTPNDSFRKYSHASKRHSEQFTNYAENGNIANTNFSSYGPGSTAGSGDFKNYDKLVNVPNLQFASYDLAANNHRLSFSGYGNETNSGSQSFLNYGKKSTSNPTEFTSYADGSNILKSDFTGYGESGRAANDSFKGYGSSGNNPHSNFKIYGSGSIAGTDAFSSYRNSANVGDDSFQSYARNSKSGTVSFSNYGKSFNVGNDSFREYGKGSSGRTTIWFKSYALGREFKGYVNKAVSFSAYSNFTSRSSGKIVKRWVEKGKFFRESVLKEGNVMGMPDIRDKMPRRSFLPRSISSKLPFSSSKLSELNKIFSGRDGSGTARVVADAIAECERAPSRGETKRCVGSAEDMMDFAISVLGSDVVVRTTDNVSGSSKDVMIGKVRGINGGKVTKSVSCHQSLYPYLLYYCHSVPQVRVYESEILDVGTKVKINDGVAICHLDTSAWGPEHGAFVALGSSPGKIEVCHWIFENDMIWTTAN